MRQKFTKGKWEAQFDGTWSIIVGNKTIANDNMDFSEQCEEESIANGRLIAAAPDLLKALRAYVDEDGGSFDAPFWIGKQAIKAIHKAVGKGVR